VRFSVVVPVYNREILICQTIDSILSQTFTDYEIIVVDDGSSDQTPDVLRSYGKRVRVIRQDHQGPEIARNTGASQSHGEYLAFLDSDDLYLSNALATYDRIVRAFDFPALILASMNYFRQSQFVQLNSGAGESVVEVFKYKDFLAKEGGLGMSYSKIVIRKAIFERVRASGNRPPITFPMEDHNLLLRAGTYGPCIIVKRPITVAYRVHEVNYVRNIDAMVKGTLSLVRAESRGQFPGGLSRKFSRYAYIGSKIYFWTWKALKFHRLGLASRLLISGGLMMVAAALKTLWWKLHGTSPSYLLHD